MAKGKKLNIPTARVFVPLTKPKRYKGAYGGRGSGKSHFFAESCVELCLSEPGTRIVCVREVQRSLKESVKRLIEDKIEAMDVTAAFKPYHDSIVTPGNGVILFQGMADHTAESIKSLEGMRVAYVEEAQTLTERSLEMLRPTIRGVILPDGTRKSSEIWFSWNPRHASDPVDKFLRGETVPKDATVIKTSWRLNPWFPEELEAERLFDQEHRPDRYQHVWEGEYEPTALGAIFNRDMISRNRRDKNPPMSRIIVAVDPPVSSEEGSDEAGIIVAGIGTDNRGYVLADFSCRGAPQYWAERAIAAHDLHDADAIVVEVNQGGEMVKHTLKSLRSTLSVYEVRATRGKHVRAEPISALYALDRVSHIGAYPELESQLCQITPAGYEGEGSPDRADALVWAFSHLFRKLTAAKSPHKGPRPSQTNNRYSPLRF